MCIRDRPYRILPGRSSRWFPHRFLPAHPAAVPQLFSYFHKRKYSRCRHLLFPVCNRTIYRKDRCSIPGLLQGSDHATGRSFPVSYTHLDVYKRQGIILMLAASISMAISNVFMRYVRGTFQPIEITRTIAIGGFVLFNIIVLSLIHI